MGSGANGTKPPESRPGSGPQGADKGGGLSKLAMGGILGGVLGGLTLLIIPAGAFLFWRRRLRQKDELTEAWEPQLISISFNRHHEGDNPTGRSRKWREAFQLREQSTQRSKGVAFPITQ